MKNNGNWGTPKNHQIANRVKFGKMELKWAKTSIFKLFNWEMPHNCCVLTLCFDYYDRISTSLLSRTRFSFEFWTGGYKSAKYILANLL